MRKKKVWRYWCDYCGKGGLQVAAMRKHESRCTLNPKRICGMCAMLEIEQQPIEKLLEPLKEIAKGWREDELGYFFRHQEDDNEMIRAMEKLNEMAEGCPACKLAAIRQSKIPVPCTGFDFKEECATWWGIFNEEQSDYKKDAK